MKTERHRGTETETERERKGGGGGGGGGGGRRGIGLEGQAEGDCGVCFWLIPTPPQKH
eukprot:COSAG03_NODE_16661_length_397_cov_1.158784_1_plen_57_part_10